MSEASVGDFFANEDLKKRAQESINNAADEIESSKPISVPGNYLCEVSTFAYREKKGACAVKEFPSVYVSPEKGSLNLNISFKVVDGTSATPKGSSIYKTIVLCPGPVNGRPPSNETIEKTMRFTKPNLITLTGARQIEFSKEWIGEWLVPQFSEEGGKFIVTKDHKMKNKVMVMVDQSLGNDNVIRPTVKSFVRATPSDKSVSFQMPVSQSNVNTTPGAVSAPPQFGNVVEMHESEIPSNLPEVEDFN